MDLALVLQKSRISFITRKINTVFIATPHTSHASQTILCLKAGKNIFVEKPLATNQHDLDEIITAKAASNGAVMVGFNRRFAPISLEIKKHFQNAGEPLVINIRVNAGFIPKEHWTQIPEIGAGRVIGEMCHFIDLMQYFTDGEPIKVFADCIQSGNDKLKAEDNISIVVKFNNGSIGNLTYVANGDKSLHKELIEVFGAGKTGVINDFRDGKLHIGNKIIKLKSAGKGHSEEIVAFLKSLKEGKDCPISFRSICLTTVTTFKIIDSLRTGLPQEISLDA